MRILNVIDLMNPVSGGGATERTYQMSRYLARAGEHVEILTTDWNLDIEYLSRLKDVAYHSVKAFYCRYLFPLGAREWLRHHVANYDVVHISKNWSLLGYFAGTAASSRNIPFVFSTMGYVEIYNRSRMLKKVYRRYLTEPLLKKAGAVIGVTNEETRDLLRAGVPPEKAHLIPNGIVPEDFLYRDDAHFRSRHGLDGRKIMLFIGRMDPIKGVHLLIDAFKRNQSTLGDWVLLLVGTRTTYRREMERKVMNLHLQNSVRFIDPLFGEHKSEAYHAAEFVVIPSIKDAMTIVAPEAACCARPVLITKTSDFGELARYGGALEVEPSVDGLSSGLDFITSRDCRRAEIGRKGYDYVMRNFRWEQIAAKFRTLFQTVSASATK